MKRGRIDCWPSSTRTELMAILEALLICPEESKVEIFTDSQAAIQAIKKSKETKKARDWIKQKNRSILKALTLVINTKRLELTFHKVKAHSGIKWNEQVDREAKEGARENSIVRLNAIQAKEAIFNLYWKQYEVDKPLREFIKQITGGITKAEWLFIRGGKDEIHTSRQSNTDWGIFRKLLHIHKRKQGESIEENKRWVFRIKCINRLLPTLDKRHLQQPDLYQTITCPRCNNETETIEHLANCHADNLLWEEVEDKIREKLQKSLAKFAKRQQAIEIEKALLPRTKADKIKRRQDLVRGVTRQELVREIQSKGISHRKTKQVLVTFLDLWLEEFQRTIWQNRCKSIIEWEKTKGITKKQKYKKKERKKPKEKKNGISQENKPNRKKEYYQAQTIAFQEVESWIRERYCNKWLSL